MYVKINRNLGEFFWASEPEWFRWDPLAVSVGQEAWLKRHIKEGETREFELRSVEKREG